MVVYFGRRCLGSDSTIDAGAVDNRGGLREGFDRIAVIQTRYDLSVIFLFSKGRTDSGLAALRPL